MARVRASDPGPGPPYRSGGGRLDRPLFPFFNDLSRFTGPAFWAHATILGDGLVCAVVLLLWTRRHPERIWGGLLGAVFMVLVLRVFKGMLSLPRPLGVLPEDALTVIGPGHRRGSFPSGHTATAALLAGVWALTTSRRWLPWLAFALATLVGVSRMAVGVHWPTDVLAGLALGWISAWVGLRLAPRVPWGMTSWADAFSLRRSSSPPWSCSSATKRGTRECLFSNESWLPPASPGERML